MLSYNADQAQRMDSNEPSAGQHTGSEYLFKNDILILFWKNDK